MVSVEMYMITVEYDKTAKISKDKELPVNKITPIYVVPFDPDVDRWESSNYMRNRAKTEFGILGVRVKAHNPETVSIQLSTGAVLSYDCKTDIWYEKSSFKLVEERYEYRTSIESLGTAGELLVTIRADNEVLRERVFFYPSGISLDDYYVILNDIYRIHNQMLFKKNGGHYIGTSQIMNVTTINMFLKNIGFPLHQINENPEQELSLQIQPTISHQFNVRTEIQKELGQQVKPSLQLTMAPSVNIYEHQLIRSVLLGLRQLNNHILEPEDVHQKRLENDMREKRENFKTNYPKYRNYLKNDIDKRMQAEIVEIKQKKEKRAQMIKEKWLSSRLIINKPTIEMEICVPVYGVSVHKVLEADEKNIMAGLRKQYRPSSHESRVRPSMTINEQTVDCESYYYTLENHSLSVAEQKLLNDVFIEAKNHTTQRNYSWLRIRARVERNTLDEHDPIGTYYSSSNYKDVYNFSIINIFAAKVGEGEWQYPANTNSNLDEWINHNCFESEDEKEKMTQSLLESIAINQDQLYNHNREEQLVKENAKMISEYLNLRVIQEADASSNEVLPTPKFLHAALYKNIWQHLTELQEQVQLDLTILNNKPTFAIRPVHNIYEVWCYFKITELLQQMGWELADKKSTLQVFREIIEKTNKPNLSQSEVVLHHGEWKIKLFYEREFKLTNPKDGSENLRPDFTFQFYENDNLIGTVFLDAKHKNFLEQGTNSWKKEIQTVAIDKYGEMNTTERLEKIFASFLIHSDLQTDLQKRRKGESYYAFYDTHHFEGELQEAALRRDEHKYGAIGLVPSETFSFTNWFRMIMEYKLKKYGTCWVCGSNDVKREVYYTKSGKEKYYYTCLNCKEFWVKVHCRNKHLIIKHTRNYHKPRNADYSPWSVYCPNCLDALDN